MQESLNCNKNVRPFDDPSWPRNFSDLNPVIAVEAIFTPADPKFGDFELLAQHHISGDPDCKGRAVAEIGTVMIRVCK